MTWATVVTCLRLLLVPIFAWLWYSYARLSPDETDSSGWRMAAAVCFLVAAVSDALDGFLARHFNQKSEWGAFLDPLADKLLLLTGIAMLTFVRASGVEGFPVWFFVLVVVRDLGLFGGVLYFYATNKPIPIRPDWSGKLATALQMVAILWILFQVPWISASWVVVGAAFFTGWTLVVYLVRGWDYFKTG